MQKIWASVLTLCALVSVFAVLALTRTPAGTTTATPVVVVKSGTGKAAKQTIQTVASTTAPQATTTTS
jgi:hypothetical protein